MILAVIIGILIVWKGLILYFVLGSISVNKFIDRKWNVVFYIGKLWNKMMENLGKEKFLGVS